MTTNPYSASDDPKGSPTEKIRWLPLALVHTMVPVILGTLLVTLSLSMSPLIVLVWLIIVIVASCSHSRAGRRRAGFATVCLQVGVMTAIVVGAYLAPVKVTDRVMSRYIELPRAEMTLGELRHVTELDWPISVSIPDTRATSVIRFPARRISIRSFVHAVEAQSALRHRFSHCGTCSTILWGGSCTFGLYFTEPSPLPLSPQLVGGEGVRG